MNNRDKAFRPNQAAEKTANNGSTTDAQQRLRLAAHILANGAIRAVLKQQANRQQKKGACQAAGACNPIANNSQ